MDCRQFIAGGGEAENESVLIFAKREAFEEAGISINEKYAELESQCSISTEYFSTRELCGENCHVIAEY